MCKPVISIIVPVYRVENYIRKCLESVQNQTFSDFECIVVDDGSPDNSIKIAKETTDGDDRFIFLCKLNGGLSSARNYGLDIANGAFIAFIDSDDWVEPTFLEETYRKIIDTTSDICMLGINYVDEAGKVLRVEVNDVDAYRKKNDFLISKNTVTQFACSKLYKSSIFDEFRFNENINAYEDVYLTFRVLYGKRITNVKKGLYNYLQRGGTLSREIKSTYLRDRLSIVEVQNEFVADKGLIEKHRDYIKFTYLKTFIGYCIVKFSLYSKNYKKDIRELLKVIEPDSLSLKNIIFMLKSEKRIGLSLLVFKVSPTLFRYVIRIWYKEKIF